MLTRRSDPPRLHAELNCSLPPEDHTTRVNLVKQLRHLPTEAFTRLQYFQPQVGCFNRCAFCSQDAGRDIWQFTRTGLQDFVAALAQVARERLQGCYPLVGMERRHRPGTLFPYLDNDVASYSYLEEYVRHVWENLGAQVRISTVGYSVQNSHLRKMHETIVRVFPHVIAGIRFSFTPYTLGWTSAGEATDATSRTQFIRDFANMLRTYRPLVRTLGPGRETICTELRFPPLLATFDEPLIDTMIEDHHVLRLGPHLLVRETPGGAPIPVTAIDRLDRGIPVFMHPPVIYQMLTSDTEVACSGWLEFARNVLREGLHLECLPHNCSSRKVSLFQFRNSAGPYYAADPLFLADGTFRAFHLYPAAVRRPVSGYTDATRFLLNVIVSYKYAYGMTRSQLFPAANRSDVAAVLDALADSARALRATDLLAATHLEDKIIPMVRAYTVALDVAGYPPSTLFDPRFTVDTGQIVNQGRARALFQGLAAQEDEPMTPREERGYGAVSISAQRGYVWRIAPVPFRITGHNPGRASVGGKNSMGDRMAVKIEELDPRHLRPRDLSSCRHLREFYIEGVDLEHISLSAGRRAFAYPGIASISTKGIAELDRIEMMY